MAGYSEADDLVGMTSYGSDGEKLGKVVDLYIDNATGEPSWVALRTGMFGMRESLVPLAEAQRREDGLHFPFAKDKVKDAPDVGAEGDLAPEQEAELFRYYGLPYQDPNVFQAGEPVTLQDANPTPPSPEPQEAEAAPMAEQAPETSAGPATSGGVPPSETETETESSSPHTAMPVPQSPPGVRLRRRIVHETQTISVPVEREEYVVETDEGDDPGATEQRG